MVPRREQEHWLDDPWWLEPEWAQQADRDLKGVKSAFAYLASIFTRDWFQGIPEERWVHNIFLREILYGKSTNGLHYALHLSDALRRLVVADGLSGVVRRLRDVSHQSDAASMELHIGDVFHRGKYRVRFPPPSGKNGKTPDIIAERNKQLLAVECKSLREAARTMCIRGVYQQSGIMLMDIGTSRNVAVHFQFNSASVRPLEQLANERPMDPGLINEFLGNLPARIREIISEGCLPRWLFHHLGVGYLQKSEHGIGATTSHPESPFLILQKIISNGIERASYQIAAGTHPGLVVIFAPIVPAGSGLALTINNLFQGNSALYENVTAVLLLPQQYWGHWIQPSLVVNNHSRYRWESFEASAVVRQHWNPRVL